MKNAPVRSAWPREITKAGVGVLLFALVSIGLPGLGLGDEQPGAPAAIGNAQEVGVPISVVKAAEESIARQEYEAGDTERGLQAPNRAHNLRTFFEPWGVRVEDRMADGSPELLRMRTERVGRVGSMSTLTIGDVRVAGARVENHRSGGIVEWYENGAAGLEHGYVLELRPPGVGELTVDVVFEGGTVAMSEGRAVIETATGRKLEYGKLMVEDATGREIPSRMEAVEDRAVRLTVADDAAVYPLVVDPLLTSTVDTTLRPGNAGVTLGYAVAGAGDVNGDGYADVIVGSENYDDGLTDEGGAFVFHGGPAGIANGNLGSANTVLQANLADARLGRSVAGAGDVNGDGYADVIVGAPQYDADGDTPYGGAAFVFHGGPTGIANGNPGTANATIQSDLFNSLLGNSVAGAGDVNGDGYSDVIVGAPAYDTNVQDEGAAFVYHGGPAGVASGTPGMADATIQSDQLRASLGNSVAGAGDVNGDGYADVIVGAAEYDAGFFEEGAAFVFHGGPAGIADGSPESAVATLQSNQPEARMGYSVAGAGDVNGDGYSDVLVGALLYDAGEMNEGAAFLYQGGPAGIASGDPGTANATLQSNQESAFLGTSVAGAGDVNGDGYADVIVGSTRHNAGQMVEGAAFVFHGGPAGMVPLTTGTPGNANSTLLSGVADAMMGSSVAGAGDVNGDGYADVIAGAPMYVAAEGGEGAVFVSLGGAEGVRNGNPTTANATLQSDQAGGFLGSTVAGAGDVNGDGYADVIVGAPRYDAGETDSGAAFLFHGGPAGIASGNPGTANATLQSSQGSALMGESVAGAGDVNGDGYADVIVGAYQYDAGQMDEGAAFVFLGGPSGVANGSPATANATLQTDQDSARMGSSVAGAGDVNGDGYADVIVGSTHYDAAWTDEGAAFVFHGGPSGVANGNPSSANSTLRSDQGSALAGWSVAGAGDVNGDGYSDVIVGATHYDAGQANEGAVFVFLGGPAGVASGTPPTAIATFQSDQSEARMGSSVAGAGDLNGDGYADVIVGAFLYEAGHSDEGAAFVFHGGPTGIASGNPGTANATLQADQALAELGDSVAGAGDVNGDGFADVIVGARYYETGLTEEGAAFVFHGGPSGLANGTPGTASATMCSDQSMAAMGSSVAGAGDVNGDGYADVIVGALFYDAGQNNEGAAFVFLGNGDGLGRDVRSRQLRGNGNSTSVEPWGSSVDVNDFQVRMTATHPDGRGRVKLEVQAVPAGQNWGGPSQVSVTSDTWTDVPATTEGVTLTETVSGLQPSTLYRWRARILHAPLTVSPSTPCVAHGPWHRLRGQAVEADIRTGAPCGVGCADGDTAGIYVPGTASWFLRNSNSSGPADVVFGYGPSGLGWVALEGDWDGDGDDTAGLYDPATGNFFLKNDNSAGAADLVYGFGPADLGWIPIVGDWDGDGDDTIGLYDPVNANFFLRNAHAPGAANLVYGFGAAGLGWAPLAGDWDGDGDDTIGLYDPGAGNFFLRNAHAPGAADLVYGFGPSGLGWTQLVGDWDGDGDDTVGLYDPDAGNFYLRNAHAPGGADVVFGYGPAGSVPITGDWDGL